MKSVNCYYHLKDYLIKDVKEFPLRLRNSLLSIGITTASQLSELSEEDLKFIYGIGKNLKLIPDLFCQFHR